MFVGDGIVSKDPARFPILYGVVVDADAKSYFFSFGGLWVPVNGTDGTGFVIVFGNVEGGFGVGFVSFVLCRFSLVASFGDGYVSRLNGWIRDGFFLDGHGGGGCFGLFAFFRGGTLTT